MIMFKTLKKATNIINFTVLSILGSIMLVLSWQKWPDVLVDFGRELYVPWQITNGAVLYKDLAYFFGPFSPYLNALLFKIFGVSLLTIAIFNIVLIIVLTGVIYRIFTITTDRLTALAVSAAFIALFAFSQFCCAFFHALFQGFIDLPDLIELGLQRFSHFSEIADQVICVLYAAFRPCDLPAVLCQFERKIAGDNTKLLERNNNSAA